LRKTQHLRRTLETCLLDHGSQRGEQFVIEHHFS